MRLSVDIDTDDKIAQLKHSERWLYVMLVAWSVKHETDGRLPWPGIRASAAGHRNVQRSIDRMVSLGLLTMLHSSHTDTTQKLHTYHISSFTKWQMNTDGRKPKPAGQEQASDRPLASGRTQAGMENRTDIDLSLSEDTLAPSTAVKDPRLIAALERIGKKLGDHNGQAH